MPHQCTHPDPKPFFKSGIKSGRQRFKCPSCMKYFFLSESETAAYERDAAKRRQIPTKQSHKN
jgi:transposase-like protein